MINTKVRIKFRHFFRFKIIFISTTELKNSIIDHYEKKIEFYREEIEIRVESLKIELDNLKHDFNIKLDAAKEQINK